jgi:hypothetical protein
VLDASGSYTLSATDGNVTNVTNNSITINAAQAAMVAIQQISTTGTAGLALPSLTMAVEDQFGNIVTTDNSTMTISVAGGPGGFANGSTLSENAVHGTVTFNNLALDTSGIYTLTGSDGSLVHATSNPITISAAQAANIAFTHVATAGTAGTALSSFTVALQDQYGNLLTTDNSAVTISVASGPGNFADASTVTVNAVNGVATFSNLIFNVAGGYTLTASQGNVASAASSPITISAAAAAKVAIQQISTTGTQCPAIHHGGD